MDFVRRFEDHQVERIRRAILDYRSKHKVGDVTLANEIGKYLSNNVTYDSTLKNIQRLRKGKRMRGATFLNACVEFLKVQMVTPPEEELGLAMKHFVGDVFGYAGLWAALEGDYVLRVLRERHFDSSAALSQPGRPAMGIAVAPIGKQPEVESAPVILSIGPGEGLDYGVARERYFLPDENGPEHGKTTYSEANALSRQGVCLPVGSQDILIMIRDFLFSHMYVLRREPFGFSGAMIMPTLHDVFAVDAPSLDRQSQYDVALQRVPRSSE
ncbi:MULTISPECIES: hypothetical protein [Chelativorans]|jgi:hypothetical protein|uniref:Uncharacterized protein n=1 Tax=Chelativorans sp. (strain BNC1) TaxID=266779 RepID=Q11BQ7_CHESB|nr:MULTISPECIES: hypothetical protein [Chelativorans]